MKRLIGNIEKYHLHLLPLVLFCSYFLFRSTSFLIHDFGNSYFPALISKQNLQPEKIVYDVFAYNRFVWEQGYKKELLDFYLNTPISATFCYPLTLFPNAKIAKLIFNCISIITFFAAVYILSKNYLSKQKWLISLLPIIFFVPIKNQIMFGQWYFFILGFVIIAEALKDTKYKLFGQYLHAASIVLKIFPVFYLAVYFYTYNLKAIRNVIIFCLLLVLFSILINGSNFWITYLFEALPMVSASNTSDDYFIGSQSLEVLLKTLFIPDSFYNPKTIFNNERLSYLLAYLIKSTILFVGFNYTLNQKKTESFQILASWVVIIYLLLSPFKSYAQILWIIPLTALWNRDASYTRKILFTLLVFASVNYPYQKFIDNNIVLQFGRLFLNVIMFFVFFNRSLFSIRKKSFLSLLFFSPLLLKAITIPVKDESTYVLKPLGQFIIYDYVIKNNRLIALSLNKNGKDSINTNVLVNTTDTVNCKIKDNEILYFGKVVHLPNSRKLKPIIINNEKLFFLTDYRGRFGLYNLKQINIKKLDFKNPKN